MGKRLRCPRCQSPKYWILQGEKRRCATCRYTWKPASFALRLTPRQWGLVAGWFVRGLAGQKIALETGLSHQRVMRALTVIRKAMMQEIPPAFAGVVEVDETYIGGARKNKRIGERKIRPPMGRGTTKAAVFGILCRGGQVWAEVVPDVRAKTLLPIITKRVSRGTVVCSDTWSSYTGVASRGYVHRLVDHRAGEYAKPNGTHINGLEGFWGYLKRRLAAKGGIRRDRLPLYLAEYVWRYNHRRKSSAEQVELIMKLARKNP